MRNFKLIALSALMCLLSANANLAASEKMEGFTEPYRTINVASGETGIVKKILVHEGDKVQSGQPLVRLDCEVQRALLAIARQSMQSEGRLDSAKAELRLRRERLTKLEALRLGGHARQEEVDRARAEVEMSEASVRTAQEDLLNRKLEHDKIKVQLDRRTVRAPVAGVITKLSKQVGEFVAPNQPEVLILVELDTLLANFTLMSPQAEKLSIDQEMKVSFPTSGKETVGYIELIAPVTDAESGTVRVKIRVDNSDGQLRSGERCQIVLDE